SVDLSARSLRHVGSTRTTDDHRALWDLCLAVVRRCSPGRTRRLEVRGGGGPGRTVVTAALGAMVRGAYNSGGTNSLTDRSSFRAKWIRVGIAGRIFPSSIADTCARVK